MTIKRHDDRVEDRWARGFFSRVLDHIAAEQQAVSWTAAIEGEQRLTEMFDRELRNEAIVLHDRQVDGVRGTIDHLVVAPSGVWVVDAHGSTGRIEQRVAGTAGETTRRLHVNNRDRTKLATKIAWQADAVHEHLALIGIDNAGVHPAICFTSADWEAGATPFIIDGVWVIWGSALAERMLGRGCLTADEMTTIAAELSGRLRTSA